MDKPKELETHDFTKLVEVIRQGLAQTIEDGYEDEDFTHYVYEAAMEAVYGKGFWRWWKAQKWAQ